MPNAPNETGKQHQVEEKNTNLSYSDLPQTEKVNTSSHPKDTSTTTPTAYRRRHKKVGDEELLELAALNLTHREIAEKLGIRRETVTRRLTNLGGEGLPKWRKNRADILAAKQRMLLDAIDESTVKKMAPRDRIWCFAVLYDKERLERGQSTQNIDTHTVIRDSREMLKIARQVLEEKKGGRK